MALAPGWTATYQNIPPIGDNITGNIQITDGIKNEMIYVSLFRPESPAIKELQGMYVEDNGVVSIDAKGFHRKTENNDIYICASDFFHRYKKGYPLWCNYR